MSPATAGAPNLFSTLDRTAGRRMSPQSIAIAVVCNLIVLYLLLMVRTHPNHIHLPPENFISFPSHLEITPPPALSAASAPGGGNTSDLAAGKGNPPRFSLEPLNPPIRKSPIDPPIDIPVTVLGNPDLKPRTDLLTLGLTNAPVVNGSLGKNGKDGIGNSPTNGGAGIGVDPFGTGTVPRPGGRISAPIVLFAPDPEFSEQARQQKVSGDVLVYLEVDTQGRPTHVRVLHGIGVGLDEKALEAVTRYRFKPAMENGHPVAVQMHVNVSFAIF